MMLPKEGLEIGCAIILCSYRVFYRPLLLNNCIPRNVVNVNVVLML